MTLLGKSISMQVLSRLVHIGIRNLVFFHHWVEKEVILFIWLSDTYTSVLNVLQLKLHLWCLTSAKEREKQLKRQVFYINSF